MNSFAPMADSAALNQLAAETARAFAQQYLNAGELTPLRAERAKFFEWRAFPMIRRMEREHTPYSYETLLGKCNPDRHQLSTRLQRIEWSMNFTVSILLMALCLVSLIQHFSPPGGFLFLRMLEHPWGLPFAAVAFLIGSAVLDAIEEGNRRAETVGWLIQAMKNGYGIRSKFTPLIAAVPSGLTWYLADILDVNIHFATGAVLAGLPILRATSELIASRQSE